MLDGAKVIAAREAQGYNQCSFAVLVGITPSTLCKIEGDRLPGIGLELAERIAWESDKDLNDLLKVPYVPIQRARRGRSKKK